MPINVRFSKFNYLFCMPNIVIMLLITSAVLIISMVSYVIWNDISVWNKDLSTIFFGSRTAEPISLGIGMTIIHYSLVGISFFAAGLILFIRYRVMAASPEIVIQEQIPAIRNQEIEFTKEANNKSFIKDHNTLENAAAQEERFFSGCLHHFGYLSTRPKETPIPQECIICQRLGDCMVATVYVTEINE